MSSSASCALPCVSFNWRVVYPLPNAVGSPASMCLTESAHQGVFVVQKMDQQSMVRGHEHFLPGFKSMPHVASITNQPSYTDGVHYSNQSSMPQVCIFNK